LETFCKKNDIRYPHCFEIYKFQNKETFIIIGHYSESVSQCKFNNGLPYYYVGLCTTDKEMVFDCDFDEIGMMIYFITYGQNIFME
jgi:hypothetical protein